MQASPRLALAIIGCGTVAHAHVEALRAQPERFDVVSCCSRTLEGAASFAARHGIPAFTDDPRRILDDRAVDAVVLCTPPHLHFEMILEALSAGKHVACEKPLTSSLALVDRIAEAEAHGTARLMPILQYRFGPGFERVRAVARSGLLGRLYVASAETARRRGPDYYQVPWRGRFATELGGVFVTQAIHIHDLLLELTGPAEAVSAFAATRVNPIEVEDCGVASLRLSGGALASLTATLGAMRQMTRIRLCWERATIECHALDAFAPRPAEADWAVVPADPEVGRTLAAAMADVEVGPAGFVGQYAAFHTALVSGGPLPVTLADARSALELVTALYHSSRTETLVTLPIGRDHPLYDGWGPG